MYRRVLIMCSAIVAFATIAFASPASAATGFTTFGDTAPVAGGTALISNYKPNAFGYGGLDFDLPGPVQFSDITRLQTSYTPESDDACAAGSPRFQINVETDSGVFNVFVYPGDLPSFTCPGGVTGDTGNLIGTNEARYETGQLGCALPYVVDYAAAAECIGENPIVGIQLVVDSGWAFDDLEQTVIVSPTVDISIGPPASRGDCQNGGWQAFNIPRTFNNQGDCLQYVYTGN